MVDYKIRLRRQQNKVSGNSGSANPLSKLVNEPFDFVEQDFTQNPLLAIETELAKSSEELAYIGEIHALEARQAELEILMRNSRGMAIPTGLHERRLLHASCAIEFLKFAPDRFDLRTECLLHLSDSNLDQQSYSSGCRFFLQACNLALLTGQVSKRNSERFQRCITKVRSFDGTINDALLAAAATKLFQEVHGLNST